MIAELGAGARPLLAEMERFELSLRFCRTTAFRVRTLQPLGYISMVLRISRFAIHYTSLFFFRQYPFLPLLDFTQFFEESTEHLGALFL